MLPTTNSVPVGIVSAIFAVPATSPVFVKVIVYVIMSPNFAVVNAFPFTFAVFVAVIIGFTTGSVGSSLSSSFSFTYAVLDIVPVAFSFTFTVNTIVAVPFVPLALAGTVSSIPPSNVSLSTVSALFGFASFTVISPCNVTFSESSSLTITVPAIDPLFVAVIVYVIVSFSTTAVLFAVFTTLITGFWYVVVVSFVG